MQENELVSGYLESFDYSVGERPCYRCRWFVPDEDTLNDLGADIDLENIEGHCRRFPPLAGAVSFTCVVDTCGEWTERNQPRLNVDSAGDTEGAPLTAAACHEIAEQIREESDSDDGWIYVPSLSMIVSGQSYGPNHLDGKLLADLIDS